MKIEDKYNSKYIENKIYNFWLNGNFFRSEPNNKIPYTLIMPPPNVTGILHMGHVLNNTIQDVLARIFRMKGYNVCWIPGTDHASIATEAKINLELKKNNISKYDLGREKFLKKTWKWTNNHSEIIFKQLKMLGCSCDWKRSIFTMDKNLSNSVTKAFIKLYNKGLIYRDYRMINWDPIAKTTISDEEVLYKKILKKLYYIKYKLEKEEKFIIIATTRPETIFGDTAICINPNDKRFFHLKNKKAIVPIVNRIIPIIEDKYVDYNFGTGCLKVTPAHDFNDKILGDKYRLKFIRIFDNNGIFNNQALHFSGRDRFEAKNDIINELKNLNLLVKEEQIYSKICLSERTNAIIEPIISYQWFLKMDKKITYPALKYVIKENKIKFFPEKTKNIYYQWIKNIKDWNISRQLWWGHRLPVYYYGNKLENFIVSDNIENALNIIKKKTKNNLLSIKDIKQESDVLDTWFSSWILPISIFNGIDDPNNKEIKYYYPSNIVVSGNDILFFWITRMIIAGYTFMNKEPFKNVYFTGIVRDNKLQKMSKSLGNSPNIIDLINKYGADSIRAGILINNHSGSDLIFSEKICVQGRNFSNKIWNAFKLIKSWNNNEKLILSESDKIAITWFKNKFNKILINIEKYLSIYKISESLIIIYKFIWYDFSSIYLEIIKPVKNREIPNLLLNITKKYLEYILKILHPYMPFISEEIWQNIKSKPYEPLIISKWPNIKSYDTNFLNKFEKTYNVIKNIRNLKKLQNLSIKTKVVLYTTIKENSTLFEPILLKMANLCSIFYIKSKEDIKVENFISFLLDEEYYFIPIYNNNYYYNNINYNKIKEKLKYLTNFLLKIKNNLSNKNFLSLAPKNIIDIERKKEYDILKKIDYIKNKLKLYNDKK